jgi:hypothetical protein
MRRTVARLAEQNAQTVPGQVSADSRVGEG